MHWHGQVHPRYAGLSRLIGGSLTVVSELREFVFVHSIERDFAAIWMPVADERRYSG